MSPFGSQARHVDAGDRQADERDARQRRNRKEIEHPLYRERREARWVRNPPPGFHDVRPHGVAGACGKDEVPRLADEHRAGQKADAFSVSQLGEDIPVASAA